MSKFVLSNIVKEKKLREVQLNTLKILCETVSLTAGPYGQYTQILREPDIGSTEYSKDGHKVLNNIKFYEPLELSIQDELLNATRNIVKTVGDGTTSLVKMTYNVFKYLCEFEEQYSDIPKFKIVNSFKKACKQVSEKILEGARDLEVEDVYKICMVSTDGNHEVSSRIARIYEDYGRDVHINLGISNTADHIVKSYDGLTMARGFASPCFINKDNNTCVINHPRLYCFDDPIDTPELGNLFGAILSRNIIQPIQSGGDPVPTVILAHSISRDFSSILEGMEQFLYQYDGPNRLSKPPVLIISGINRDVDFYNDLTLLCGAKTIKKYIDPNIQKKDIEEGKAPTIDNVCDFYGEVDEIISDNDNTTFINPSKMFSYDEDGNRTGYTPEYNSLIAFLEAELKREENSDKDAATVNMLKRRLRSLQSNYVEYLVGGIAVSDREASKDLIEDAVLNCKSAAMYGVGYGANFEILKVADDIFENLDIDKENHDLIYDMLNILYNASWDCIHELYCSCMSDADADREISESLQRGEPINLRTMMYQQDVLCTINSDPMILDTISKLTIAMFNTNQALLVSPLNNKYIEKFDEDAEVIKNPNL